MNIPSAAPPGRGLPFAEAMKERARTGAEAAARKTLVETEKSEAMASPRFAGPEAKKSQARARIQQLIDWLKIVRKLYAQDPRGMAKALAQVFKDLKSAVKAYRDAGGQEMSLSGAAVGGAMTPAAPAASKADTAPDAGGEAGPGAAPPSSTGPAEAANPGSAPTDGADPADDRSAAPGAALYQAVVGEVRKAIGEDGLGFIKDVRGLTEEIHQLLQTARGQAAIRKPDKATDKAFEEADKALKALHEEMDGMERDIHAAAPAAGLRLSIAA